MSEGKAENIRATREDWGRFLLACQRNSNACARFDQFLTASHGAGILSKDLITRWQGLRLKIGSIRQTIDERVLQDFARGDGTLVVKWDELEELSSEIEWSLEDGLSVVEALAQPRPKPPAAAERLLSFLVSADRLEEALGDTAERFVFLADRQGVAHARRWYWCEVVKVVVRGPICRIVRAAIRLLEIFHLWT